MKTKQQIQIDQVSIKCSEDEEGRRPVAGQKSTGIDAQAGWLLDFSPCKKW